MTQKINVSLETTNMSGFTEDMTRANDDESGIKHEIMTSIRYDVMDFTLNK